MPSGPSGGGGAGRCEDRTSSDGRPTPRTLSTSLAASVEPPKTPPAQRLARVRGAGGPGVGEGCSGRPTSGAAAAVCRPPPLARRRQTGHINRVAPAAGSRPARRAASSPSRRAMLAIGKGGSAERDGAMVLTGRLAWLTHRPCCPQTPRSQARAFVFIRLLSGDFR